MLNRKVKILGISGSPSETGSTVQLLNHYLDGCRQEGAETKIIYLEKFDVAPCKACMKCRSKDSKCYGIDDDVPKLFKHLEDADGIVLSTPVYYGDKSAAMSIFFERTLPLRRADFKLKNKIGGVICTGHRRNGGSESALKMGWEFFIRNQMLFIGGNKACPYGPIGWGDDQEKIHSDIVSIKSSQESGRRMARLAKRMQAGLINNSLSYSYSSEAKKKELRAFLSGESIEKFRDKILFSPIKKNVCVTGVYATNSRLPKILIEEALKSAKGIGAKTIILEASDIKKSIEAIKKSQAVIMASDSFYGSYNPKFVDLFTQLQKLDLGIDQKIFAAISSAKERNGGQENIIKQLWEVALRKKMIIVGGSSGSQYGVLGWEHKDYEDYHGKEAAKFLGQKIAKLADMLYCK